MDSNMNDTMSTPTPSSKKHTGYTSPHVPPSSIKCSKHIVPLAQLATINALMVRYSSDRKLGCILDYLGVHKLLAQRAMVSDTLVYLGESGLIKTCETRELVNGLNDEELRQFINEVRVAMTEGNWTETIRHRTY
jgi:hypothetical protein